MGRINSKISILFLLLSFSTYSQIIQGVIFDEKTGMPIESAAVYFDGTSIGTSTNADGEFRIQMVQGVTSPLIISFLGYQKIIIPNYEVGKFYKILLIEDLNTLDEIVITTDDGIPREVKLQQFRKEFLGKTPNGMSCKILNESDLILKYNSKTNQLTASSKKPIIIENGNLKYLITFDIQDFVIDYLYVDVLKRDFGVKSVIYTGTSFYSDSDTENKKKTIRQRDKVYDGSVLHFMRALSKENLIEEGYQIFTRGFIVKPFKYITVSSIENSTNVVVNISQRINILYDKNRKSILEENQEGFVIDIYGNYAPVEKVLFGGDMGNQRVGDSLPFDYKLTEDN